MSFSEIELKRIDNIIGAFCERRIPPHVRDQLRLEYETKRHDVVLFERRPDYGGRIGVIDSPVAKFKFVRTVGEWRLFWQRADLKWHLYEPLPRSRELEVLVAGVDDDPYGCFFG